jgi:Fe-S-cluster containining protein
MLRENMNPADLYPEIQPDETFCYTCFGCGDCCRNVKDAVMVESLDLFRIAGHLGLDVSEVADTYTDSAIIAPTYPVLVLKTKKHMNTCIFLKSGRCSVYESRPRTCRLYPLGVGPDEKREGEFQNYVVSKKKHHFTGQEYRSQEWVDVNFTEEERAFVNTELQWAKSLYPLIRRVSEKDEKRVLFLSLMFRYFRFDTAEDFLPQYERNMRQFEIELKKLTI